jgi:uncharacterized protein
MKTNRVLLETIMVMVVTVGGMILLPQAKIVFGLIPVIYLLAERQLRKRPWSELGFRFGTFWQDLRACWVWVVLVGVVMQPLTALLAKAFFPPFLEHVLARLPLPQGINWLPLVLILAVSLLMEELTFRSLFQGRLAPVIGTPVAIILVSFLFAISHFSPGAFAVVAIDIVTVFLDSILYGIIYARRNNLIVVWLAHLLGDLLGLVFLLNM